MELRQIRQFVTLAETLNFHRAARALNMTQPPLSISIRKLETEMGVMLFERQASGVALTEAGRAALPHARAILSGAEAMRDAARATVEGMSGPLHVAFVGSAVPVLLPRVVPLFRRQRPAVDLHVREATTLDIIHTLESGDLDVGVLRTPCPARENLVLEELSREELVLLLPGGHGLREQTPVRLEDLHQENFIGYDGTRLPGFRDLLRGACAVAGFQPRIVAETAYLHSLIALVESGLGIALAPGVSHLPEACRIAHARLTVQGAPIMIGLAWAMRRGESRPACHAFAAALREVCRA